MKTQKARGIAPISPSCKQKSRFTLLSRKRNDSVIQGKLRVRSFPGAFLVLGIIVVVVGSALAVAGYWPDRISRSSILGAVERKNISRSLTTGWSVQAKGFLSTAGPVHTERMKLLGPVIMGVGLFILICANTVLYENRDRETQMLLAQMRSVICSVSAAVPSADLKEIAAANSMAKRCQWVSSLPAAHLNFLCLQQLASSEPLLQTRHPESQEDSGTGVYQHKILQTEALHHQESPGNSLHSSYTDSRDSSRTDFKTQFGGEHGDTAPYNLQAAPFVELNSCLVSACSMSSLGVVEGNIPVTQPRRCHSISYRTSPYPFQTGVGLEERLHIPLEESQVNPLVIAKKENNSQVFVNIHGQAVDGIDEQTCRSWPRLDLSNGRRYLKLENKEDSLEKLLDQLEQQCLNWDKSFGSGPFQ